MAQPTVTSFGKGILYIGDGTTPDEVFTKICGFNSLSLSIEKDTNDVTIPDCDDSDAPAWRATDVLSLAWSAEAEGIMAKEAEPLIWAATNKGTPTNIRLRLIGAGTGSGTPDLQFAGAGHVSHSITGERGSKWQVSVAVEGDGALVRSNVAALA